MGHSLGTGATVDLASDPNYKFGAIVLHSPLLSIIRTLFDVSKTYSMDMFASIDKVHNIHHPVMVIHAKEDEIIYIKDGEKFFDLIKDNNPYNTFLKIDKGGHNISLRSSHMNCYPRIKDFFCNALKLEGELEESISQRQLSRAKEILKRISKSKDKIRGSEINDEATNKKHNVSNDSEIKIHTINNNNKNEVVLVIQGIDNDNNREDNNYLSSKQLNIEELIKAFKHDINLKNSHGLSDSRVWLKGEITRNNLRERDISNNNSKYIDEAENENLNKDYELSELSDDCIRGAIGKDEFRLRKDREANKSSKYHSSRSKPYSSLNKSRRTTIVKAKSRDKEGFEINLKDILVDVDVDFDNKANTKRLNDSFNSDGSDNNNDKNDAKKVYLTDGNRDNNKTQEEHYFNTECNHKTNKFHISPEILRKRKHFSTFDFGHHSNIKLNECVVNIDMLNDKKLSIINDNSICERPLSSKSVSNLNFHFKRDFEKMSSLSLVTKSKLSRSTVNARKPNTENV